MGSQTSGPHPNALRELESGLSSLWRPRPTLMEQQPWATLQNQLRRSARCSAPTLYNVLTALTQSLGHIMLLVATLV